MIDFEDDPDAPGREQRLQRSIIDPLDDAALDDQAEKRHDHEGDRNRDEGVAAELPDDSGRVGAHHDELAVRHVDDAGYAENDGEPERDDDQDGDDAEADEELGDDAWLMPTSLPTAAARSCALPGGSRQIGSPRVPRMWTRVGGHAAARPRSAFVTTGRSSRTGPDRSSTSAARAPCGLVKSQSLFG